jgi:hypothetical protein
VVLRGPERRSLAGIVGSGAGLAAWAGSCAARGQIEPTRCFFSHLRSKIPDVVKIAYDFQVTDDVGAVSTFLIAIILAENFVLCCLVQEDGGVGG